MLEQLKRPFKRHYDKYRAKADGFVGPIKDSASKLFAMIPKMEAFAGSEDLAGEADADAAGDVGVQKGASGYGIKFEKIEAICCLRYSSLAFHSACRVQ